MKKLKSIEELESGITDPRFLALFRAFVKAIECKDYEIVKQFLYARWLLTKFEKITFKYGINYAYKIVYRIICKRDYLYWEKIILENNMNQKR